MADCGVACGNFLRGRPLRFQWSPEERAARVSRIHWFMRGYELAGGRVLEGWSVRQVVVMTMTYARLSCYEFGRRLIESNDLDPVYVVLHRADCFLAKEDLEAWLLAYFCFYHVGTASWILDEETKGSGHSYWEAMAEAAASKDYPRSPERRHFRGQNAIKSVEYLEEQGLVKLFAPFDLATSFHVGLPLKIVMSHVQTWVGFGPWIAFKVADMLERLGLCTIDFSSYELYDSPNKGAAKLWIQEIGSIPDGVATTKWAIERIIAELGHLEAPPRYERVINAQEAETVLCKWHSYMSGHYELGEDIEAVRRGLLRFARTPTAQRLLRAGKEAKLW